MSDISIRLDGIVLLAAVAFGALTYLAVGLIAGGWWLANRVAHRRSGGIAAYALSATAIQVFVFAVVFGAANGPHAGADVIDWFSIPYLTACIAGYLALARLAGAKMSHRAS